MAGLTHYCPSPSCGKFSYHLESQGARAAGLKCRHCGHVARQNPHPPGAAQRPAASAAPGKRSLPAVDALVGKLQERDTTAAGDPEDTAAAAGGGKPRRRPRAKDSDEAQDSSEGEGVGS